MKNEVKNEKSLSLRLHALDIVIVLLLVAAIVSIGLRWYGAYAATEPGQGKQARVTFVVKGASVGMTKALTEGDTVYFSDGGVLGTLSTLPGATAPSALVSKPATELVYDGAGSHIAVDYSGGRLLDLQGRIIAYGTLRDDGAFVPDGGIALTAGQSVHVYTETVNFILEVTAIEAAR